MSLYLDTSVLVPLFVPESQTRAAVRWIGRQESTLFVADLVVTEFNSVISRLVRETKIDEERAADIRAQFELWRESAVEPIENAPADIRAAGLLVRTPQPKLLAADAIHLATCHRLGLTLVTDDQDLLAVAEREGARCERLR